MATLAERIWDGQRVRVTTGAATFTIVCKEFAGLKGFGVIPDGRKRPVRGRRGPTGAGAHRIMSREDVENWADRPTPADA